MNTPSDQKPLELSELDIFSKNIGSNIELVQGSGGNISIKIAKNLWIKASGKKLRNSLVENIFLPLDLAALQDQIDKNQFNFSAMKPLENNFPNLRPSIETGLHGIIPRKYVVHLHPIGLLSTLVRPNIKEKIEKFYSCDEYLLVPYKKPGEGLTQYLNSARKIRNLPKLIFLANHGVVISGETLSDVEISLSKIVDTFSQNSAPRVQVKLDLIQQLTAKTTWHLPIFDEVQLLAQDKAILNLALSGILFPDHIVFLGNSIHSVPAKAGDLISWLSQPTIKDLPYLIVPQLGVLTNPNLSQDGHELLLAWCRILREIPEGEKINYLHADEINDIYQWEAEAYRRRLSIDQ